MDERVFISYKRDDYGRVKPVKDYLELALGLSCWIDVDGIESDAQFANVIIGAINKCDVFLFMYSERHLQINDFDRDWTVRELSFAERKGKRIVFINIDNSPLSDWFEFMYGTKQQVDASDHAAMKHLSDDLKNWLGAGDSRLKIYKVSESRISRLIDEFTDFPDLVNIDKDDLQYLYKEEKVYYTIIPLTSSENRFKTAFEQLKKSLVADGITVKKLALNIKMPEGSDSALMVEFAAISDFVGGLGDDVDMIWGFTGSSIRYEIFVILS